MGEVRGADGMHARVVERLVLHGEPTDFRTLCMRAVPRDARYIVLDLDRTTHLGRNLGELLGWEICAYVGYGPAHLAAAEPRRPRGRFYLDPRRPLALVRYLAEGLRAWARPGLFYFGWSKVAALTAWGRLRAYVVFGADPVREIQSVPQMRLLQQLATLPASTARELARAVWRRHAPDQVIERADIDALRARCPGARIVIASASPRPMLEIAAEELGVDAFIGSDVTTADARPAAPVSLRPPAVMARTRAQDRLVGPGAVRLNVGQAKIEALLERFPDFCDPGVVTVGISDNGYGEDRAFSEFCTHVVDLNTSTPFAPIVTPASRTREVHSAAALSRLERERRAAREPDFVDARRRHLDASARHAPRVIERAELEASLGDLLVALEREAARYELARGALADVRAELEAERRALSARVERDVARYNGAAVELCVQVLGALRRDVARGERTRRRMARRERPLAEAAFAIISLLDAARARLAASPEPRDGLGRPAVAAPIARATAMSSAVPSMVPSIV